MLDCLGSEITSQKCLLELMSETVNDWDLDKHFPI
jgi:hypothetical protein